MEMLGELPVDGSPKTITESLVHVFIIYSHYTVSNPVLLLLLLYLSIINIS